MDCDITSLMQTQRRLNQRASVERKAALASAKQSYQLALAAQAAPDGSETKRLFESFKICGQCQNFVRFGL